MHAIGKTMRTGNVFNETQSSEDNGYCMPYTGVWVIFIYG
jgi:hypothetical protein